MAIKSIGISKKTRISRTIALWAAVCLLASCDFNVISHSYRSTPSEGWNASDTLHYPVKVDSLMAPAGAYTFNIEVRNTSDYRYENLYLLVHSNIPDSTCFNTDTLLCTLMKDRKWVGKGWGTLYQASFVLKELTDIPHGDYCVKITHAMTDKQLQGISDVGIKLENKQRLTTALPFRRLYEER